MEDKDFTSIFRGSAVEADAVHDYLEQLGVGSLVRNHMQENLNAGWMTADSEHAADVFVSREDASLAKAHANSMFNEEGEFIGAPEEPVVVGTAPEQPVNNVAEVSDDPSYTHPHPVNREPMRPAPITPQQETEKTPPPPPPYEI